MTSRSAPARRSTYRHGDLRAALLAAGVELARTGGPGAVVLREATRRAGVVPNAAYRHFADRGALLHAVCAEAMSALATAMEEALASVPPGDDARGTARARLRATGVAYLRFARAEPGLFRTAFADPDGPDAAEGGGPSGRTPFGLLADALDGLVTSGDLPAERRPDAEYTAWAAVHGLAMLVVDGPLARLDAEHAERVQAHLLDVVQRGL